MAILKMNKANSLASVAGVLILLALTATSLSAQAVEAGQEVEFGIVDRNGKNIGNAKLAQEQSGVRVRIKVSGLTEGKHGVHIHSVGVCEPPAFKSSGPHYSPENGSHGFLDSNGPHAGDLPMLEVGADGEADDYNFVTSRVSLNESSLKQPEGTSLIIHAKADDYLTDTGGGTGDRIACGVISSSGNK